MNSLVERPREEYRQLRVQCVFCVHIIFLRHCARGLTAVAKLDRPSAPLSPLAQTKCLIVTAAGRHSSHSAGPSAAAPLGDRPPRFPERRRHPPRVRHRHGGRVAGGARGVRQGKRGRHTFLHGRSQSRRGACGRRGGDVASKDRPRRQRHLHIRAAAGRQGQFCPPLRQRARRKDVQARPRRRYHPVRSARRTRLRARREIV